jgi:hypothetical protein
MIGLGWIMMYNSIVEKCIDDNNNINQKNELKKNNINLNNIIVVNKI